MGFGWPSQFFEGAFFFLNLLLVKELINQAKQTLIQDYLSSVGYKPVRGSTHGKYLCYHSMLRDENEPSFFVNKNTNRWRDMGSSAQWQDVIELVKTIEGVGFKEAIEKLLNKKLPKSGKVEKQASKPGIEIENKTSLESPKLLEYLKNRSVDIDIARNYCEQVTIKFANGKNPDQLHTYIGFRNDKGGYELRNHYNSSIKKLSTSPKYFTRIAGEPNNYNLFEGFIDYLSLLTRFKTHRFKNTSVVLNSLVNFEYLYQTLKDNDENIILLNNDEPADKYIFKGDKKLNITSLTERGINYTDKRDMFKFYNDINDMSTGKILI